MRLVLCLALLFCLAEKAWAETAPGDWVEPQGSPPRARWSTDLNASGGSDGAYARQPKGNLDVTGTYFIWTTNLCGNRMDAFLVKVPAQLLIGDTSHTASIPR